MVYSKGEIHPEPGVLKCVLQPLTQYMSFLDLSLMHNIQTELWTL